MKENPVYFHLNTRVLSIPNVLQLRTEEFHGATPMETVQNHVPQLQLHQQLLQQLHLQLQLHQLQSQEVINKNMKLINKLKNAYSRDFLKNGKEEHGDKKAFQLARPKYRNRINQPLACFYSLSPTTYSKHR